MKGYLVLFLSTILLLFALPKSSISMRSAGTTVQGELRKSCQLNKRALKRTCTKKCIKHQSHSEQQGAANLVTDCSQQVYALVTTSEHAFLTATQLQRNQIPSESGSYIPPELATDPDPPRFS